MSPGERAAGVAARLRLAGAAASVTGHWLRERVTPARPLRPGEVPPGPAALNRAWLTDALCRDHPGAEVVDFAVGGGSDGTSARRALSVSYNEAGTAAGLPTALYTKSSPSLTTRMGFRRMFRNGVRRSREFLPPDELAGTDRLWNALEASLELRARAPQTLLHQDVHARNWYFTGAGHIGVYDWQANAKGLWAVDVAYALSCGLEPGDRRAWERDLIGLYLDRLAAAGGKPPTFDEAWLAYRQQMIHGLGFWLATIGVTTLQPELQPRAVCEANIRRMARAVADLDTLGALGI